MATTTYGIYSGNRRQKGTTKRAPKGSNGVTQVRTSGSLLAPASGR